MSDLYDGTENRKFGRIYKKETPDILEAFVAFDNAVFAEEGRAAESAEGWQAVQVN